MWCYLFVVGAVPPWLQDDPLEGTSAAAAHPEIGPSLQDFLKQSKDHTHTLLKLCGMETCCQLSSLFALRNVTASMIISMSSSNTTCILLVSQQQILKYRLDPNAVFL